MIKALRERIQSSECCCSATRRDKPFCWGRHNLPAPFSEPRRKHTPWQHENKHRFDQPIHKHHSVRSILSTLSYYAFLHFAFN